MGRILLVEDDTIFREGLEDILSDSGHWVQGVSSGEEAVAWSRKGHDLDLVLADVRMVGMDGITAFNELRRDRPNLRGIIMTGYASTEAPRRAVHADAWDYLYKPFGQDDLLRVVDQVLRGEEREQESRSLLGGWVETARRWIHRSLGIGLEAQRQRAFRAFYTGVRSRLLGRNQALAAWDELERVDELYRQVAEEEVLAQEYDRVLKLIKGLSVEQYVLYHEAERKPNQISTQTFGILFRRVYDGLVPPHLLSNAPFLRLMDPQLCQANNELLAMYQLVWGSG